MMWLLILEELSPKLLYIIDSQNIVDALSRLDNIDNPNTTNSYNNNSKLWKI